MGIQRSLLRAAAGRWSSLAPTLVAAVVVFGFLSVLGALLELPNSPAGAGPSAVVLSTTGSTDMSSAILGFWRASPAQAWKPS